MHLCPRSALVGCALALASSPAFAFDAHPALAVGGAAPSTLAVYGDAPYGTTPGDDSELKATPAFIDNVNADPDVSIVLHVGDIHSGKQYCTERDGVAAPTSARAATARSVWRARGW